MTDASQEMIRLNEKVRALKASLKDTKQTLGAKEQIPGTFGRFVVNCICDRSERDSLLTKEAVAAWLQSEEAVRIAYGATEGHGSPYIRSILARLADRIPAAFGEDGSGA